MNKGQLDLIRQVVQAEKTLSELRERDPLLTMLFMLINHEIRQYSTSNEPDQHTP